MEQLFSFEHYFVFLADGKLVVAWWHRLRLLRLRAFTTSSSTSAASSWLLVALAATSSPTSQSY